jgi:hypothetical protein
MEENKQVNNAEVLALLTKIQKENQELKQALISGNTDGISRASKEKGHTAHVRVIDGQVVVGFKNRGTTTRELYIYPRQDPYDKTKRVNYVDVVLEDGTVLPVDYIEFFEQTLRVKCRIVDRKEFHWKEALGKVSKKEVPEGKYDYVELDEEVDQVVKGVTFEYTLELPEEYGNRRVKLSDDYGLMNA